MRLELVKWTQESVYFIPVITLVFTNRPYIDGGNRKTYYNLSQGLADITGPNDYDDTSVIDLSWNAKINTDRALLVSNKSGELFNFKRFRRRDPSNNF